LRSRARARAPRRETRHTSYAIHETARCSAASNTVDLRRSKMKRHLLEWARLDGMTTPPDDFGGVLERQITGPCQRRRAEVRTALLACGRGHRRADVATGDGRFAANHGMNHEFRARSPPRSDSAPTASSRFRRMRFWNSSPRGFESSQRCAVGSRRVVAGGRGICGERREIVHDYLITYPSFPRATVHRCRFVGAIQPSSTCRCRTAPSGSRAAARPPSRTRPARP